MEHLDAIRLCLFGIIALAVVLWTVPVKCEHPCIACDLERVRARMARELDAHKAWHHQPVKGCPYCRGGEE